MKDEGEECMIFHVPLLVALLLFIAQAHFGLTYHVRATIVNALLYSWIVTLFFLDHDLVILHYLFAFMFWLIAISTFLQRNSWKRVKEIT